MYSTYITDLYVSCPNDARAGLKFGMCMFCVPFLAPLRIVNHTAPITKWIEFLQFLWMVLLARMEINNRSNSIQSKTTREKRQQYKDIVFYEEKKN